MPANVLILYVFFCLILLNIVYEIYPCCQVKHPFIREGNGTPLQYSCLENPMDRGAWWAAVHGVAKSWTRLRDFTFTFHFHALEKEMATHSSVLAWRIPGTGEPGGCHLWCHTESDTTEATQQQQQYVFFCVCLILLNIVYEVYPCCQVKHPFIFWNTILLYEYTTVYPFC